MAGRRRRPGLARAGDCAFGDRITDFGDARFVSATAVLEVRVAEMPTPASGDSMETGGRLLIVQGEPLADALRLGTVECRPA